MDPRCRSVYPAVSLSANTELDDPIHVKCSCATVGISLEGQTELVYHDTALQVILEDMGGIV